MADSVVNKIQSYSKKSPSELRLFINSLSENDRREVYKLCGTTGLCSAYLQANVAILHKDVANEFLKFCELNPGPCPLLYKSEIGELSAKRLAPNGNIGKDVIAYMKHSEDGSQELFTLENEPLKDFVSFYLGCSYSMENHLMSHGIQIRNVINRAVVSVYVTSIDCNVAGPFHSKLVVSMRPIPIENLNFVLNECRKFPLAHGMPVHIGNPALIGIHDMNNVYFGSPCEINENEVPAFWCCGITSSLAIKNSNTLVSYSHYPGNMHVTDVKLECESLPSDIRIFALNNYPFFASVLTQKSQTLLDEFERIIATDKGERGIKFLLERGELCKAALSLSHSKRIAIMTGFPCYEKFPHYELDGPPGAFSLANALGNLKKSVSIIVDDTVCNLFKKIANHLKQENLASNELEIVSISEALVHSYDAIVAIERSGEAVDLKHYRMTGKPVYHLNNMHLFDKFFHSATENPNIFTIGIGDGGNELGTGKALQRVRKYIPHGEKIGCHIKANFTIFAGISNWGGYALAQSLYILRNDSSHCYYVDHGLRNTSANIKAISFDDEIRILEILQSFGINDPLQQSSVNELTVDGIPISDQKELLKDLLVSS